MSGSENEHSALIFVPFLSWGCYALDNPNLTVDDAIKSVCALPARYPVNIRFDAEYQHKVALLRGPASAERKAVEQERYQLSDGVLFRRVSVGSKGQKTEALLRWCSPGEVVAVIRRFHVTTQLKHQGYHATHKAISAMYGNVSRDFVRAFVRRCHTCHKGAMCEDSWPGPQVDQHSSEGAMDEEEDLVQASEKRTEGEAAAPTGGAGSSFKRSHRDNTAPAASSVLASPHTSSGRVENDSAAAAAFALPAANRVASASRSASAGKYEAERQPMQNGKRKREQAASGSRSSPGSLVGEQQAGSEFTPGFGAGATRKPKQYARAAAGEDTSSNAGKGQPVADHSVAATKRPRLASSTLGANASAGSTFAAPDVAHDHRHEVNSTSAAGNAVIQHAVVKSSPKQAEEKEEPAADDKCHAALPHQACERVLVLNMTGTIHSAAPMLASADTRAQAALTSAEDITKDGGAVFYVVGDPNSALTAVQAGRSIITCRRDLLRHIRQNPLARFVECNSARKAEKCRVDGWKAQQRWKPGF